MIRVRLDTTVPTALRALPVYMALVIREFRATEPVPATQHGMELSVICVCQTIMVRAALFARIVDPMAVAIKAFRVMELVCAPLAGMELSVTHVPRDTMDLRVLFVHPV